MLAFEEIAALLTVGNEGAARQRLAQIPFQPDPRAPSSKHSQAA